MFIRLDCSGVSIETGVRETLRLLADHDGLREAHAADLRKALAEGLRQADGGELLDGPKVVAGLRKVLRARARSKQKQGRRGTC